MGLLVSRGCNQSKKASSPRDPSTGPESMSTSQANAIPTSACDGMAATAKAGCLLVLNNKGAVVETISGDEINGPWDMTALDKGTTASLFVTNVLNGTVAAGGGTVTMGTCCGSI